MVEDITRRLIQQERQEAAQRARDVPVPLDPKAVRKAQIDETRRLTREVLAKLKEQNNTDDWQLVTVGDRRKSRRMAGYPIAQYKHQVKDTTIEETHTIWLLENGRYVDMFWNEMKVEDLATRGHIVQILSRLRDLAADTT